MRQRRMRIRIFVALAALAAGLVTASSDAIGQAPAAHYWAYVANESSDLVSLVRFGPGGAVLEKDVPVGIMPADVDGAHGLAVSPDGRHYYVSLAHGTPFGRLWKLRTGTDVLEDSTTLGLFPASIGITPDGSMAFVVNFNLHGDPVPSSVSAVFLPMMREVARIETCVKPHGSRVSRAGAFAYSVCVGDDQLVEVSVERLAVRRRLHLTPGQERELASAAPAATPGAPKCGPTWVVPSHDDRLLYVACNAHGDVLEIDAKTFRVTRRFPAGKGPYNLDVTSDGRYLLATNKGGQSVSVFDLKKGMEAARIATSQPITHGVVVTPDDRYAFVSNEAIGATPGTVDVIDLRALKAVASVAVHHQPGGIDLWKMEPAARGR
ncbi:MAG: YncE family protein [Gemmatimonadota bacterium]